MYTKISFGIELKQRVLQQEPLTEIGTWAYEVFLTHSSIFEHDFLDMLIQLNTLELGPEFALSYTILNKIADDVIAGKKVDLSSPDYCEPN